MLLAGFGLDHLAGTLATVCVCVGVRIPLQLPGFVCPCQSSCWPLFTMLLG